MTLEIIAHQNLSLLSMWCSYEFHQISERLPLKGKLKTVWTTLYLKWNMTWILRQSLPSKNDFILSVDREQSIVYIYFLQGVKYQQWLKKPSWYWHKRFLQARNQTFVLIQFIFELWFTVLVCMILCLHKEYTKQNHKYMLTNEAQIHTFQFLL